MNAGFGRAFGRFVFCVCAGLAGHAAHAADTKLQPMSAEYSVLWGKTEIAAVSVALMHEGGLLWRSRIDFKPRNIASFFANEVFAEEDFNVRAGRMRVARVEYKRDQAEPYESYTISGNGRRAAVVYKGERYEIEAPPGALGKVSMMLQASLLSDGAPGTRLSFPLMERGKARVYEMVVADRERIQTPLGELDTRVVNIRRKGALRYRCWLDLSRNSMPVQIERLNDDGGVIWTVVTNRLQIERAQQ